MANPTPGVPAAFLVALDRLGVSYEFDTYGSYALTDAFLSAGTLSAIGRVADEYGIALSLVDNVLSARRRNYKGLGVHPNFHFHMNHHPYYSVN